jgi:hypothetical protein
VNTLITSPLMPGAMMNLSRECLRWCRKSRKNRFFPAFCRPDHRVELGGRLVGEHRVQEGDVRRRHLHVDQEIRPVREKEDASSASSISSASKYSVPDSSCFTGTTNGYVWMPLTTRPTT